MARHQDLVGAEAIHQATYIQSSDPGAVGAWKIWVDITVAAAPVFKYRDAANAAWVTFNPAPGTHVHSGADITSGTVAAARIDNLPASQITSGVLAMARLATGTPNGLKFVRDDGTLAVPAGGGGGGGELLDVASGSPDAASEEFTSASLDAKWTVITTPDASLTVDPDEESTMLSVQGPGHATNIYRIRGALVRAAGTAFNVTGKFFISSYAGSPGVEINCQNGSTYATGSLILGKVGEVGGYHRGEAYDGTSNPTVSFTPSMSAIYITIQRNASNVVTVFVGSNLRSRRRLHSVSAAYDINYLFLTLFGPTASAPGKVMCDWVRVDEARYDLPL